MSIKIDANTYSSDIIIEIDKDLEIKLESDRARPKFIYSYTVNGTMCSLPFAYAVGKLGNNVRPPRSNFDAMDVGFSGEPNEEQQEILSEATALLNKRGCVMISMYTGGGKTFCAIRLACVTKLKPLVITNTIVMMKHWKEDIQKFTDANVQLVNTKTSCLDPTADFYVMYAQTASKLDPGFFDTIGCVICDEAHLIMAETLSKSLSIAHPRYLIGLTATPYRPDGLDILLTHYFGEARIVRKLWRKHIVYRVDTGFKPILEKTDAGTVNWNKVLDSQAENEPRNELIIRVIRHFHDKKWIVLIKRISQGKYLVNRLRELGEIVASFVDGESGDNDREARIVIGTTKKIGTGYNNPESNALMIAGDIEEYAVQYLGRVFRKKDTTPIVVDLVDNNGILYRHFETRCSIYLECGGKITNLSPLKLNTL